MNDKNVTVNGKPVKEYIGETLALEIQDVRSADEGAPLYRHGKSTYRANASGAKTAPGKVVYREGQKEQLVRMFGKVVDWKLKAPYVPSGLSTLGAIEMSADQEELKCHECGKWVAHLGRHVFKAHHILARAYRARHGLSSKSRLCTASLSNKRIERNRRLGLGTPQAAAHMRKFNKQAKRLPSAEIASYNAAARGILGLGFSRSPELANWAGKCMAQITDKILASYRATKETPTIADLKAIGIPLKTIEAVWGVPYRRALLSIGLSPRPYRRRTAATTA